MELGAILPAIVELGKRQEQGKTGKYREHSHYTTPLAVAVGLSAVLLGACGAPLAAVHLQAKDEDQDEAEKLD